MADVHRNRSHLAVALICPPLQRFSTSLYKWLSEIGSPTTVVAIHATLSDFHQEARLSRSPTVDLVVVARDSGEDDVHLDALRKICAGGYRVVVFGTGLDGDAVLQYLEAGAVAFVAGDRRRSGYATVTICTASELRAPAITPARVASPGLTHRECEVLAAWCHASTKEDVAGRLAIERATVSSHLQRIRAKYASVGRAANTKAALIARAIQDGLVDAYDL